MTTRPFNSKNAGIYKISCKDENVKEIYVGSSTNFKCRKNNHKSDCNNEKSRNYNYNLYKYIRENGGWDNFEMVEVCKATECINKSELLKKENEYIKLLGATLNFKSPTRIKSKNEYSKDWYEENKEKLHQQRKEYREENRDEINRKAREIYEKNKDERNKKSRERYEKNKDEINKKHRERYALKMSKK